MKPNPAAQRPAGQRSRDFDGSSPENANARSGPLVFTLWSALTMVGSDPSKLADSEDPYRNMQIAGVFRLDELIGIGTTGRVYRAQQLGFKRSVAVKVLRRDLMQTAAIRERFHREARLASRLNHPGLVRVLASGEIERRGPDEGGEAYLVFEYLEGSSFRQYLQEHGRLSTATAVALMIAAGDAVGEAHERHIIHRDLKPENIMLVSDAGGPQRVVVLDFGLARALDHEQDPLTRDGAILGTPQYMSPEAARGDSSTPRSDVYSLATILYELLAGDPPFAAESPMMVLMQQVNTEPPPVADSLGIPAPIVQLLFQELAKAPESRSQNARQFAIAAFEAALRAGLPRDQLVLPQLSDEILERFAEVRVQS